MSEYTYYGGQKLYLNKKTDEFVTRALPEDLRAGGFDAREQLSSQSSRVKTSPGELEETMAAAREVAPTHHAYTVDETSEDFLLTDRILVRFREVLPDADVAAFAGRYGLFMKEKYGDRDYLFQVLTAAGRNPVKIVVDLNENASDIVEMAENDANMVASTYARPLPTDPSFNDQWHLHTNRSHPDFDARSSSLCVNAWEQLGQGNILGTGNPDVVIGVTDDGCRLDHADFNSTGKFAQWGYFVGERLVRRDDGDAEPEKMYQSGSNHGTSCAGVIAAESDTELTVGAAPGCRLLPIKWESSGSSLFISDSKLLTAINFMASRVDIVSNSWGSRPTTRRSAFVTARIRALAATGGRRGKGIVFLWAAGNENCPVAHSGNVDVPFTHGWAFQGNTPVWVGVETSRTFVNNLAGIENVMIVAALASTARRSHYSNYGTGLTLCAPTSNSHAYGRGPVRGLGITTASGDTTQTVTSRFGGTSSATPLVAGIAALVISANPDLTAAQVISILKRTAGKDLDTTPYVRTPPANFDPNPNWDVSPIAPFVDPTFVDIGDPDGTWSPWFGHGRADAGRAVEAALQSLTATPVIEGGRSPKLKPIEESRQISA